MNQRPYATMVTNFDSTEQKRSWERLLQEAQSQEDEQSSAQNISSATLPSIEELWLKNSNTRTCESLLNAHTSFATYFAGIIRTAYLYCPQIMLSDAEVCDGLFFLALGPNTVNSLLGNHIKMARPSLFLADVIRLRNACSISRSAQLGLFKRRLRRRQNETIIYIMQLKMSRNA